MPETPAEKREANEKLPKAKGKLDKYKWYLVGGLGLVAVLVFYFVNKSNQNAQQSSANTSNTATQPGIDPTTGQPYALEYAGMGGFGGFGGMGSQGQQGQRGQRGQRGPRGKPGPRGKRGKQGKPHGHGHWIPPHRRGALAPYTPQGRMTDALRSRALHNSRIIPAANQVGPGF